MSSDPPDTDRRRLPPLNAIKAFEATARLGGVSAAARELGVTPGAVSQQLRLLEEHAGVALLARDASGQDLTERGVRLQQALLEAFVHLRIAADVIYGAARNRSLTVSVPPTFAQRWLAPRMARFAALHPDIEVWVSADARLIDVAGGRADVAIRYGRGQYPGLSAEVLLSGGVTPVCSPVLLNGPEPLAEPTDLANHTLIHVERGPLEEPTPDWSLWLRSRGLENIDGRSGPRYGHSALAIEHAVHGRGVALAPCVFVMDDIRAGRLTMPFADGYLETDSAYRVVSPRGKLRDEVRAFLAWLHHEASDDPGTGEL